MELLTCQQDAYRRTMETTILNQQPAPCGNGIEVQLRDALLYPEGGGQPDDTGTIDGQAVLALRKDRDGVVWHRLAQAPTTTHVTVAVDWPRRFDHMQQHTAQHLLTALAHTHFGAATTAFHLRADICDIDLDRMLSPAELTQLETMANDAIVNDLPVSARVIDAEEYDEVRSRGLPRGFTGPIRLIEIQGIDSNTCGGTHVDRLGALQAISLLPIQKNKGGAKLRYLAGGRVLTALHHAHNHQLTLSKQLSCGPTEHHNAIDRLQQTTKSQARTIRQTQEELATLLGGQLAGQSSPHLHRPDGDMHVLRTAANAATNADPTRVFFFTGDGVFLLAGPADRVAETGPQVATILQSRGGGRQGRFQGKLASLTEEATQAILQIIQ